MKPATFQEFAMLEKQIKEIEKKISIYEIIFVVLLFDLLLVICFF